MDKENYKELLSDTIIELNKVQKESDRLLLLASKYMHENSQISKLVYDNPNNMELGKKIRNLYREKDNQKDENQLSLLDNDE